MRISTTGSRPWLFSSAACGGCCALSCASFHLPARRASALSHGREAVDQCANENRQAPAGGDTAPGERTSWRVLTSWWGRLRTGRLAPPASHPGAIISLRALGASVSGGDHWENRKRVHTEYDE